MFVIMDELEVAMLMHPDAERATVMHIQRKAGRTEVFLEQHRWQDEWAGREKQHGGPFGGGELS